MAKQDHGDGAFIDFGEIPTRRNESDGPSPKKPNRRVREVTIAWLLAVALIISLTVITLLSRELNQASHKIDEQNQTIDGQNRAIEELNVEIGTLKSKR